MKIKTWLVGLLILFMLSSPSVALAGEYEDPDVYLEGFELAPVAWEWASSNGGEWQIVVYEWIEKEKVTIQHYDPHDGTIVCWSACWHEIAHKLDHYSAMASTTGERISGGEEFRGAVRNFLWAQMNRSTGEPLHPMTNDILLFQGFFEDWFIFPEDAGLYANYVWGGHEELYADILDWAEGDIDKIPEIMRHLYDMDMANKFYSELEE